MISHRVQKRLTHEVHEALALRDKRGQSKHKDKQAARKAAQDNHTAYKTITGLSMCFPRKKALVSFAPSCARRIFASKRRC